MSNPTFYRLSPVTETLLYTSIFIPSVKHLQHFKYFYQLYYVITVMSQKIKFTTPLISIWRWVHCMFRAHLIKFLLTKPCSGKQQLRLRQQSVTQLCHYLDSTKPHGNKSVRKKTRTLWNLRTVDVGSSSADVRKAQKYSTVCLVIMLKIWKLDIHCYCLCIGTVFIFIL